MTQPYSRSMFTVDPTTSPPSDPWTDAMYEVAARAAYAARVMATPQPGGWWVTWDELCASEQAREISAMRAAIQAVRGGV